MWTESDLFIELSNQLKTLGPHSLCWISGVVPYHMWLILSWEKNKYCYKLKKCTKWHLFHSKWSKLSWWVKIVVIWSVAQLVTMVKAWDKSHVKWDNSRNSTQKMRTFSVDMSTNLFQFLTILMRNIIRYWCVEGFRLKASLTSIPWLFSIFSPNNFVFPGHNFGV